MLTRKLEDLVTVLLLPAFFAFTGMRTRIGLVAGVDEWLICGLIILTATAGMLALISALCFGGFMIAINGASEGGTLWAVTFSRLTTVVMLAAVALAVRPNVALGRRDAAYDDRPPTHFTDHAPHEFRRERPILQHEVTAGLLGDDERAGNRRARHDPRRRRLDQARRLRLQREQHHQARRRYDDTPSARQNPHSRCLHAAVPRSLVLPDI